MLLDYNTLLNEAIDGILLEKLSISEDVVAMSSYYTKKVCDLYMFKEYTSRETKYVNYARNEFAVMVTNTIDFNADFNSNNLFPSFKRLIVEVYEFVSKDEMNELSSKFKITAVSVLSNGTILMKVPSINGVLDVVKLKTMMTHEFEHFLQYDKMGGDMNGLSMYETANAVLDSHTSSKEEKAIAMAVYRFNKREMDAKVHELSIELNVNKVSSQDGLNKCKTMIEMNDTLEKAFDVLTSSNDIDKIVSLYKVSKEKMAAYLKDGIQYFRNKVGKVYQRHVDLLIDKSQDIEIYR